MRLFGFCRVFGGMWDLVLELNTGSLSIVLVLVLSQFMKRNVFE